MSGAIGKVLKDAAQKIEQAIEDAGKAVRKHFDDTGTGLRKSAESHAEHDTRAAKDLEHAAKHPTEDVAPRGGGGTSPTSAGPGTGGPDIDAELARTQKFGDDVRAGHERLSTNPATRDQFPPGYRPMQGRDAEDYLRQYSDGTFNKYGDPNWNWEREAPHNGALGGHEVQRHLEPGRIIDRYGEPHGKFLSPDGTPYPDRGLPADNLTRNHYRYRVVKPLPVHEGVVKPAFGEPGLGTQYRLNGQVKWYVAHGYLEEVK